MRDVLLEIGSRPAARRLIGRLGLPLPLPQKLTRGRGAWEARPLADQNIVVGGTAGGRIGSVLAKAVAAAGGYPVVASGDAEPFREIGKAYGRPATTVDLAALPSGFRAHALVFDATELAGPATLRGLYDFFHPLVPVLRSCGRAVVLGRPPAEATTIASAAARGALDGFVRSLAKEIGRRGSTANLVWVGPNAETRIEPVLRFLLSARSAFVTGQPITIDGRVPGPPEPPFVRPLEGKVALVTGAARGIGKTIAERLSQEGAHVVCLDRPADDAAGGQVAQAIGGSFLGVDIAEEGAPATIAAYLRAGHGGVDVVVHNAGVTRDKTLARMSPEMWDTALAINLVGSPAHRPGAARPRAAARRGADRLPGFRGRDRGQRGADELRRFEGGNRRLRSQTGGRARVSRHHGERRRAGAHRDSNDRGHAGPGPRGRPPPVGPRAGGLARRRGGGGDVPEHAGRRRDQRSRVARLRRRAHRRLTTGSQRP